MESKRRGEFKKGITSEDGRRRREETAIQLRKAQREEGLAKRRNIVVNNFLSDDQKSESTVPMSNSLFHKLMMDMQSPNAQVQIDAVRNFRRQLSVETSPPVQECINIGAVPFFVEFLKRSDISELQFEAAWALTNIASTEKTGVVVESGAVSLMVELLMSPNADVREQCAWCLGNIAGDCTSFRDIILKHDGLTPLLKNISMPSSLSLLRNCTWALSNFCRGKPQPNLRIVTPAYEVLGNLLKTCTDQATIIDACWALSYLTDGDNDRIQLAVDLNIIDRLVNMLTSGKVQAIVPALRILGNIVSGNDLQTQAVVQGGVLSAVVPLLSHVKKNIRKEACWLLSNIAAGNIQQVGSLLAVPNLLSSVLNQGSAAAEWDVRKEAAWVISNIATGGSKSHVIQLIEHGVIQPLCDYLDVEDVRILLVVMEAMESVLKVSEENNFKCAQQVDEFNGLEKLELLQEHENLDVYEKAVKIIEKFFQGEEEGQVYDSENVNPGVSEGNKMFSFGLPAVNQTSMGMVPSNKGGFSFDYTPQTQNFF